MQEPAALFQDLANIEMVALLNEGFCELHHRPYCAPSEELSIECNMVRCFMPTLQQTGSTVSTSQLHNECPAIV